MTIDRTTAAVLVATLTLAAPACGPKRVATPAPASRTMVVLLADPDKGADGGARVSNPSGSVDLAADRDSTEIAMNQSPAAPTTISASDVQRVFGDALAALPPSPRRFVLFFQFDSDELTEEARKLLPEILRVVSERPVPEVDVVGHTDTTGATQGNYVLGMKRAGTVRELLLKAGLSASLIDVKSHGEADLAIRTPDNRYEQRNRRVEVAVR
jgi:outer membrane protein OmpA-like peptidoglycan-associated protein